MKIVKITIIFEPTDPTDQLQKKHATLAEFEHGMWTANGPLFSRISAALHDAWKLLRITAKGD